MLSSASGSEEAGVVVLQMHTKTDESKLYSFANALAVVRQFYAWFILSLFSRHVKSE